MCVYFHKNCSKNSIIKFLAYRVYEGYDKSVEDETSHSISTGTSFKIASLFVYTRHPHALIFVGRHLKVGLA